MAFQTVTLTGTYKLPDGTAASGTIEVIPSERQIIDDAGNVILSGRVKVQLDTAGSFSIALPATDDPGLTPTGFGYTVVAKMHHTHLPAVSFSLPAAVSPVDITDVTTVDPSTFAPDANYVTPSELTAASTTDRARANHTGTQPASTISDLDGATTALINDTASESGAALSATFAAKPSSNVIDDEVSTGSPLGQHAGLFGQVGQKAKLMSGNSNAAFGYVALADGLYAGVASAAVGTLAGQYATTGSNLALFGYRAGGGITTATYVAYGGSWAGAFPSGSYNTGFGGRALGGPNPPRDATNTTEITGTDLATWKNTTPIGARNTAVGYEAMTTLGSGSDNVAVGHEAFGGIGAQLTISAITVSGTTVTVTVTDSGGLVVGEPFAFFGEIGGFSSNSPTIGKLYNVTSKPSGTQFTYEQDPAPVGTYTSGGYVLGGVITASNSVAVGSYALYQNQRGGNSVAVGHFALKNADVGTNNTALGYAALASQKNATSNVAVGANAGTSLTTGGTNTLIGANAGLTVTTANATTTATGQTVVGYQAGQGSATAVSQITAVGHRAVANGSWATAIGANTSAGGSGAVANGCVAIGTDNTGAGAQATAANSFVLGTANHRYKMPGLPTTNPGVGTGVLWNDAGTVKVA